MRFHLRNLEYAIEGTRKRLVVHSDVLAHFEKFRQSSPRHKEAGGQLFGTFHDSIISISHATGPYPRDRRTRFRFTPSRIQEQTDIDTFFQQGRHFLGNWHTHPEIIPRPSGIDVSNTQQRFSRSVHQLLAFTMIIVGTAPFPLGLSVSLVNAEAHTLLETI